MKEYWKKRRLNHKVVSVSRSGRGPVFDIQVPFYNNFALAAGVFVHNSTVYDEAIDIPSMNVLIMAGGGKSFRRTVQRIGRPLHSKQDFVHVIDFWDYQHPYLQRHSRQRSAIYNRMEYLQFKGVEELNRRILVPVDPSHLIMEFAR
jgi:hypothetical protein